VRKFKKNHAQQVCSIAKLPLLNAYSLREKYAAASFWRSPKERPQIFMLAFLVKNSYFYRAFFSCTKKNPDFCYGNSVK
jgi:hypothetical protein